MGNTKRGAKTPSSPCYPSPSTGRGRNRESGKNVKRPTADAVMCAIENRGELIAKEGSHRVTGNTQKIAEKLVAVSAAGRPIGEDHPKAVLANAEVELVFALRDERDAQGRRLSIGWIAKKMEVSKSCIQHILSGRRRGVTPAGYRRVKVTTKEQGK